MPFVIDRAASIDEANAATFKYVVERTVKDLQAAYGKCIRIASVKKRMLSGLNIVVFDVYISRACDDIYKHVTVSYRGVGGISITTGATQYFDDDCNPQTRYAFRKRIDRGCLRRALTSIVKVVMDVSLFYWEKVELSSDGVVDSEPFTAAIDDKMLDIYMAN